MLGGRLLPVENKTHSPPPGGGQNPDGGGAFPAPHACGSNFEPQWCAPSFTTHPRPLAAMSEAVLLTRTDPLIHRRELEVGEVLGWISSVCYLARAPRSAVTFRSLSGL